MEFNDELFKDKLRRLTDAADVIQSTSKWMQHHRRHAHQIAQVWADEVTNVDPALLINFLYLANDVVQNSRRRGDTEFLAAFQEQILMVTCYVFDQSTPERRIKVIRIIHIWRERNIFAPELINKMFEDIIRCDPSIRPEILKGMNNGASAVSKPTSARATPNPSPLVAAHPRSLSSGSKSSSSSSLPGAPAPAPISAAALPPWCSHPLASVARTLHTISADIEHAPAALAALQNPPPGSTVNPAQTRHKAATLRTAVLDAGRRHADALTTLRRILDKEEARATEFSTLANALANVVAPGSVPVATMVAPSPATQPPTARPSDLARAPQPDPQPPRGRYTTSPPNVRSRSRSRSPVFAPAGNGSGDSRKRYSSPPPPPTSRSPPSSAPKRSRMNSSGSGSSGSGNGYGGNANGSVLSRSPPARLPSKPAGSLSRGGSSSLSGSPTKRAASDPRGYEQPARSGNVMLLTGSSAPAPASAAMDPMPSSDSLDPSSILALLNQHPAVTGAAAAGMPPPFPMQGTLDPAQIQATAAHAAAQTALQLGMTPEAVAAMGMFNLPPPPAMLTGAPVTQPPAWDPANLNLLSSILGSNGGGGAVPAAASSPPVVIAPQIVLPSSVAAGARNEGLGGAERGDGR
ncbi:hypothetical protein H9P43_005956 [Blastocladiella emersonii ATCC 22665]|nr:hypothetical protein H9P43_005956 [Blastocladiella emersonii ATCC 22665]